MHGVNFDKALNNHRNVQLEINDKISVESNPSKILLTAASQQMHSLI